MTNQQNPRYNFFRGDNYACAPVVSLAAYSALRHYFGLTLGHDDITEAFKAMAIGTTIYVAYKATRHIINRTNPASAHHL